MRRTIPAVLASITLVASLGCGNRRTASQEVAVEPTAVPTAGPATLALAQAPPTSEPTLAPTSVPTAPPASPTPLPSPFPAPTLGVVSVHYGGQPLSRDKEEFVVASGLCAYCHDDLVDTDGLDVSIGEYWCSTMMASAARDPYWQASVRAETLSHPELKPVIEAKCATCHTPLAWFTQIAAGQEPRLFEGGLLDGGHVLHGLAMDGVSCAVCHQVQPTGLGEAASFSGGWEIDDNTPLGERDAFGPYTTDERDALIMQKVSGFRPEKGEHLSGSELCATCHTLYTPYLDSAGQIVGEFPEQTPYFELLHSAYADTHTCQNCHMPEAGGEVQISPMGGPPRAPFSMHAFVGGNAYMLELLKQNGEGLGVTASSENFDATIARARDQLQSSTANVAIENLASTNGRLSMDIVVTTLTGHKFPTGFPSRRAWLHVVVRNGQGQLVFESGAVRPDGSIVGNDNDEAKDRYELHYQEVTDPDQVQIYEPILKDTDGGVTTVLLRGSKYAKDNRLLPLGFEKHTAGPDFATYGRAAADADFGGGGDRTRYAVDVGSAKSPFVVDAELLYQSVGYRWAKNLDEHDADETRRFAAYYEAVSNEPIIVSYATAEIGE